ncbi:MULTISPECIES: LacI family DNA-binding transcriptional regulator [Clostridium]|uniref:LacI family DNA-binding transcriptional regulator n=1 Tax=Clostridium TaxID=1485 RepID=UPI0003165AD8|nr:MULTISPECIES: LacI family DNA-binding transcriptional regulator [Clostridium]MBN1037377.1 LacI family transcriptional regulator [Clostridium botulinum]MBN1044037.1 LacI family transcriptional regulator [Clostridium botulinum]NFN95164.1 LacI family transcriptional regulator [Clostridium botulinum]NFR86908.1 LacI family transcriptional regulator [Clostridium botulinum]NFR90462.1 LacI family transcriptional regulator [Clostridium botulinum]
MKVTIKEVAKEANVSTSTVSRVLSDSSQISEETKSKVREAVKKLKYKPNAIARSLANNKTRIIGVILPNEAQDLLTNPFFIQAMKGMSVYAQSKNYYITYAFSKDEAHEAHHVNDFINSNLVDGICLLRAKSDDDNIRYLKETGFPFVVIGRPEETDGILWVDNDNFKATYDLVNDLVKRGKKKIAFLGARKEWNLTKDRINGFKVSCQMNGINIKEQDIIIKEEFTEQEGIEATNELLKLGIPDAIVAEDDMLAFGSLKVFKEKNLKDISIIGFNNTQLAEFQNPPLASVDINAYELGYYAAKILIDSLENNNNMDHYIIDTNLVVRDSIK